jgi:hypothetical protein
MKDRVRCYSKAFIISAMLAGISHVLLLQHPAFAGDAPEPPLDISSRASVAQAKANNPGRDPFILKDA